MTIIFGRYGIELHVFGRYFVLCFRKDVSVFQHGKLWQAPEQVQQ